MAQDIGTMCFNHKLAIVIPAFKAKYLPETLDSIAAQTDQRFCVYIGDDCSPENIGDIVSHYKGIFNYVYQRFDTNLGGKDLVAQWERCIEMTQGEEWIWLFSDDDCMDINCVSEFYRYTENVCNCDLLHYNLKILDASSQVLAHCEFPPFVSSEFLYKNKIGGSIQSFAIEYIFRRRIYNEEGGFENFDMAWGSDTATWMKFGKRGIGTIPNSEVAWRSSGINITSINDDYSMALRKLRASNNFLIWAKSFWREQNKSFDIITDVSFVRRIHGTSQIVSIMDCLKQSENYFRGSLLRKYLLIIAICLYEFASRIIKR